MSNHEFKDLVENGSWALKKSLQHYLKLYKEVEESTDRSALSVEEQSQFVVLYQVQQQVEKAFQLLDKLNKPVIAEGCLHRNSDGRYEVEGYEVFSGRYIEYFVDSEDGGYYLPTRVEFNGTDYYVVALGRDKAIEGLQVRLK